MGVKSLTEANKPLSYTTPPGGVGGYTECIRTTNIPPRTLRDSKGPPWDLTWDFALRNPNVHAILAKKSQERVCRPHSEALSGA
jgi:hypothetical protein